MICSFCSFRSLLLLPRDFTYVTHFLYNLYRHCLDKHLSWFLRNSRTSGGENIHKISYNVAGWNLRMGYRKLSYTHQSSTGKNPMTHMSWRRYSIPASLEESSSLNSEDYSSSDDAIEMPKEVLAQPLGSDEVKSHFLYVVILWWVGNKIYFLLLIHFPEMITYLDLSKVSFLDSLVLSPSLEMGSKQKIDGFFFRSIFHFFRKYWIDL